MKENRTRCGWFGSCSGEQQNDSEQRAGQRDKQRRIVTASLLSLLLPGIALADDGVTVKKTSTAKIKHEKYVSKAPYLTGPVTIIRKGPLEAAAPIAPCSAASAKALDRVYGFKGWWALYFPSYGDTITQDYGCWRSKLASYGLGLIEYEATSIATNTFTHAPSATAAQGYWGQKTSVVHGSYAFLTYDLGMLGLEGGQFQVAAAKNNVTWIGYFPNNLVLNNLGYYQALFDKQLEFRIGILGNNYSFFGTSVGGSLTGPFGPSASIPSLFGVSQSGQPAPSVDLRWNITNRLYDEFAVQRSLVPAGNPILADHYANPVAIDFSEHANIFRNQLPPSEALFYEEFGYKNAAAPDDPQTWIRGGGLYNTSKFFNYKTQGLPASNWSAGTTDKWMIYALADRQIFQSDPSSPATAYRGIYLGATAMYTPPETTAFSQYYEGRMYALGPFDSRPFDLTSFVFVHQVISHYLADKTNALDGGKICPLAITCARHATNSATISYTARLYPGIFTTVGLQYTDHPSVTYIPAGHPNATNHALNFLANMYLIF